MVNIVLKAKNETIKKTSERDLLEFSLKFYASKKVTKRLVKE